MDQGFVEKITTKLTPLLLAGRVERRNDFEIMSKPSNGKEKRHLRVQRVVWHPATSSINRMKRLYRKLCEEHPDPKVQRIAQAMESALRWATEDTRGWRMKEEPILLAQCLADDMRMPTTS